MKSMAWTPDRRRAEKFAIRWQDANLGGGELYEIDAAPEHVLIFVQKKHEDIVVLSPEYTHSAEIRPFVL